jgi:hypothetical protein
MWEDPIVAEVRAVREKQAAALGYDIRKIVAAARRKQRSSGHRLVSFVRPKKASALARHASA